MLNERDLGYEFPVEETKQRLSYILSLPSDKIFVAELESKVVGYIHLSGYDLTYSRSLKNIMALAVDRSCRKMGVGKALINNGEEWAKANGAYGIRLVSGFNRPDAHKFYLACGYAKRKEQVNFIKMFE